MKRREQRFVGVVLRFANFTRLDRLADATGLRRGRQEVGMEYPVWDVSLGGPLVMAIIAVAHVIVSHFAVGGGLVIVVTEALAVRRGDHALRELARRSSFILILVSTVFGAISGVGIWVVAGLISPAAISSLIHTYVWGWAIEWTFFVVEIVAALVYYATWDRITKAAHLVVGWVYFIAAFLSLVVINGIITFMLTPGRWLETHAFWDGFFNPTYWPSLVLRTGICAMMAAAFMLFAGLRAEPSARPRIMRYLSAWSVGGALLSYGGYRWWEAALSDRVRDVFRGATPLLPDLATTRSVALWALAIGLAFGLVLMVMRSVAAQRVAVTAVAATSIVFFAGYERVREGVRKPFLIHDYMFSNGLAVEDIEHINDAGMVSVSGWVATRATSPPGERGKAIFDVQCRSCHTIDGYNGITAALPSVADMLAVAADDPAGAGARAYASQCSRCHRDVSFEDMHAMLPSADDIRNDPAMIRDLNRGMIDATLATLRNMGDAYTRPQATAAVAISDLSYPTMPPAVGNDEDLEALATYLSSLDEVMMPAGQGQQGGGS